MTIYEVTFQPEGKRAKINKESTILEAAQLAGVDLISVCGGKGTCCKCKVKIDTSQYNQPISEPEKRCLTEEELSHGIRLACQIKNIDQNLIVVIPENSRSGKQRLQVEGIKTPVDLDLLIEKTHLHLKKPTLEDPRSDADRLFDKLKEQTSLTGLELKYDLLTTLGLLMRSSEWDLTVSL